MRMFLRVYSVRTSNRDSYQFQGKMRDSKTNRETSESSLFGCSSVDLSNFKFKIDKYLKSRGRVYVTVL